jgi:hypothetical protein
MYSFLNYRYATLEGKRMNLFNYGTNEKNECIRSSVPKLWRNDKKCIHFSTFDDFDIASIG